MLTRVVGKGRVREMHETELDQLRAASARTVVDVGTGDGRFAYARATAHPDSFVIGIDAIDEPMGEIAQKAMRRPERGGRPNLLLLRASIEHMPSELGGKADEVTVVLPWGRLLEGIVCPDDEVPRGVARLCRPAAHVSITLNGEIWLESTPARFRDLPAATPEHVAMVVAPAFAAVGIRLSAARWLEADEAKAIASTWARKLGHGRAHPRFLHIDGVAFSLGSPR
jgi:16S rRNA (adenine(1408)-N(1))-methyltransferase